MSYSVVLVSAVCKVNYLYIDIYPLSFRFFFHLFPQPPIVFIKGSHGIEVVVSAFLL